MNITELKALVDSGEFHHATYRNQGSIWEGLYIYKRYHGLRGFDVAGQFGKGSAELSAAHDLVAHTGVSVGEYGGG